MFGDFEGRMGQSREADIYETRADMPGQDEANIGLAHARRASCALGAKVERR